MTTPRELLRNFIRENHNDLKETGGGGTTLKYPELELYARDYLGFAEQELMAHDGRGLINCVAHLKRAMDCQLSIFLYLLGLDKVFDKRNLKFDKKIEFLQQCGIFYARTLSRLNAIRNRMEHSYEYPKVQDIEAYFDLVVAFVSVLERTVLAMCMNERQYSIDKGDDSFDYLKFGDGESHLLSGEELETARKKYAAKAAPLLGEGSDESSNDVYSDEYNVYRSPRYWFYITYDFKEPRITVEWELDGDKQSLIATTKNMEDFVYFLRVFMLLVIRDNIRGDKYTVSQLLL